MPSARIHLPAGSPRPAVRQAMANVRATLETVLDAPADRVSVWVVEVDAELWSAPGPVVQVAMIEGRPIEVVQHLIREVTKGLAHALGVGVAGVRVVVETVPADLWGIGGLPATVVKAQELSARSRSTG